MLESKKSQVVVFIILGIFVLIMFVFIQQLSSKKAEMLETQAELNTQIQAQSESLNFLIRSCNELLTKNAINRYGLEPSISEDWIADYIESRMESCADYFELFEDEGFTVDRGVIDATVEIGDEIVQIDLQYSLELTKENLIISFEQDKYVFNRKTFQKLKPFEATIVSAPNGNMELIIPPGTQAKVQNTLVDRVGLMLLDREFDGLTNSVLMGMIAYELLPDNAEFSQKITIIMYYDPRDVPITIDEKELVIGYYDEELDAWIGLPTTVNAGENTLTAETTHFTAYGILLRCTPGDESNYRKEEAIKEKCRPCTGWTLGMDPDDIYSLYRRNAKNQGGRGNGLECKEKEVFKKAVPPDLPSPLCDVCNEKCPCNANTGCCDKFQYFNTYQFVGTQFEAVGFEEDGNTCFSEVDAEGPYIGIDDENGITDEDAAIFIKSECVSDGDKCFIKNEKYQQNQLVFTLEAHNEQSNEACLEQNFLLKFKGFGVQQVGFFYPCDNAGEESDMPVIGGHVYEEVPSICTCYPDKPCMWEPTGEEGTPTEETEEGTGIPRQPYTEDYPTCPDDFEQNFSMKTFVSNDTLDTRTTSFRDFYGDFPKMQYTSKMSFSQDTELLIFDSALRKGHCWYLVEAQQRIPGMGKPDFFVKSWQVNQFIS